jgi:hypothetical protein
MLIFPNESLPYEHSDAPPDPRLMYRFAVPLGYFDQNAYYHEWTALSVYDGTPEGWRVLRRLGVLRSERAYELPDQGGCWSTFSLERFLSRATPSDQAAFEMYRKKMEERAMGRNLDELPAVILEVMGEVTEGA